MIIYEKLFEVNIFHEFYNSYSISDIEFELPSRTHHLLSMYALLFKRTSTGFVVLYKQEKAFLLQQLKESIQFTFFLKMSNRYLANFTLLDYRLSQENYYFNNSSAEQSDKSSTLLHPQEKVQSNDVVLNIHPNTILSKTLGVNNLVIEKTGAVIFQGELTDTANAFEFFGSDYGLYSALLSESKQMKKFYYEPPNVPEVFGTIDLFVGNQENMRFEDVRNRSYEIRFASRKVHWTYYFISNVGHSIDGVEIASGKTTLSFSQPRQVTLVNGKTATSVTSEESLPLKSSYNGDKLFATISNSSSKFPEKRIRLPSPDVNKIKGLITSGTQTYFSEMYIYV